MTVGDEWLTPWCYAFTGFPASVYYIGPENVVDNVTYHTSSTDCTGPSISLTVVRAIPTTPEQAALQCTGLVPGSVAFEADTGGLAFPADAWVCNVPPPAAMWVRDDFRVAATSPGGAVVTFSIGLSQAGSFSCSPAAGTLFPLGAATVTCAAQFDSSAEIEDSFTITLTTILATEFAGRILPFDRPATEAYAQIAATRRASGAPISAFDAQIAGISRSRGAQVATRNVADFDGCGIGVVDPWTYC